MQQNFTTYNEIAKTVYEHYYTRSTPAQSDLFREPPQFVFAPRV
jgi:hypothetical protein